MVAKKGVVEGQRLPLLLLLASPCLNWLGGRVGGAGVACDCRGSCGVVIFVLCYALRRSRRDWFELLVNDRDRQAVVIG